MHGNYNGGYGQEQGPLMSDQDYGRGGGGCPGGYQQGGYPPQGSGCQQGGGNLQGGYPPQTQYPPPQYNQGGYNDRGGMMPPTGGYGPGGFTGGVQQFKQMPMTTSMNVVFFAASCCVMIGSLLDGFILLLEGSFLDALELFYLLVFGGMLAALDTPFFKNLHLMWQVRMYIGKYANVVARVTGKGATFVFVGCTLFCTMVNNTGATFTKVLCGLLCIVPVLVGIAAIVIGLMKSHKLNKARVQLASGALEQRYDQYAQTYRGQYGGLTPVEFNTLTQDNGGFHWEDADLALIFNALVKNPSWRTGSGASPQQGGARPDDVKIPREDLMLWIRGGMVWL